MTKGQIFAVVGPSGAGKDTLMAAAARARPDLHIVRRVITRPATAGGEDFEGVTEAEFTRRQTAGEFTLTWPAHGLHYGIPTAECAGLAQGQTILFNGSRLALSVAQTRFPTLVTILVTAPNSILVTRLAARGREDPADIEARLIRAGFDLPPVRDLRVVQNDATPDIGLIRFLRALQPSNG